MPSAFAHCADHVRQLRDAVIELERESRSAEVPPLAERGWYELLTRKLVPQMTADAFLVVAVVGGTNIGKSVVFNHIAGCRASAASPLASGTKHPTCLVPEGFTDRHRLEDVFPGFVLRPWTEADGALQEDPRHLLFWRTEASTPDNLLVLDTPDIDSDARINWERADHIRQCADVLIAVLTQQKYNDAAVKEFFRKAAVEDKAIIVVFNQCLLPEDEPYWPLWVETFCRETGIQPDMLYIAPADRRAAEELTLPFYERPWPIDSNADSPPNDEPRSLLEELSNMRFAEIKLQTIRGSLRQLVDSGHGVPAYLSEIRRKSDAFRSAADLLSAHQLAEINNWPAIPNTLLVDHIRRWWQSQREGWSAKVHGFYNAVGTGLLWPVRTLRHRIQGEPKPPMEIYREREWAAILDAIEKVFQKLTWMAEIGNDLLRPRLDALLSGVSRTELIERIRQRHGRVDLDDELERLVASELADFRDESPEYYAMFRKLDTVAAAVRPATSVVLFVTGFGPVGHVITPALTDAALQSVMHVAGDVAGGTIAAAVGETVISGSASTGAAYLEAKFRRLHAAFTGRRAAWLAGLLKEQLLGDLPEELQRASQIPRSDAYQRVERLQAQLAEFLL